MSGGKSYSVIPLLSTRMRPSDDFAIDTVAPPACVPLARASTTAIETNAADAANADMATLVIVGTAATRLIARPGLPPLVYTPRAATERPV